MHYFTFGHDIACVESADQAAKYEAAGWERVSMGEFMQAWKERDAARQAELRADVQRWIQSLPYAERRRRGV